MKAAAISKTSDGTETVVAIFEAPTLDGIKDIMSRWLPCSGRIEFVGPNETPEGAQKLLEKGLL